MPINRVENNVEKEKGRRENRILRRGRGYGERRRETEEEVMKEIEPMERGWRGRKKRGVGNEGE
jgi:hypothetical protein